MSKKLALFAAAALLSTASHNALAANYAYFTDEWITGVQYVHQGLPSVTTFDGVQVNAINPVLGNGITIGNIDTGSTASWIGFQGAPGATGAVTASINCLGSSTINPATHQPYGCVSGSRNSDANGHGTFTMSEEIGGFNSGSSLIPGVAPNANAISVQVLNAQGSGSYSDASNGIIYAATHGAQVLNLSLGPFTSDLIAAVNTAAAQGAYIVFAGGNSSQPLNGGANMSGLTNAALQHLLFVGSTNSSGQLSSFSNTPGAGYFTSTTGQKYSYASLWLVADGENLTGASNLTGMQGSVNCGVYSCITSGWSGTSMAAPQVTGAIALLLSEWPILKTNGSATTILEYAATGLNGGSTTSVNVKPAVGPGFTDTYNTVFGQGFLNIEEAFTPMGALTATNLSGKTVAVSSITNASALFGPAVSGAALTTALSHYTAFDMFQRNFSVNLSALAATKTSSSSAAVTVSAPSTSVKTNHFADGSSLAFGSASGDNDLADVSGSRAGDKNWFMSFTDATGSTLAAGSGFPASASFANALWGNDSPAAGLVSSLGVSDAMLGLAEGGSFAAFGTQLDKSTRLAFSWSQTQTQDQSLATSALSANAHSFGAGVTTDITQSWKAGMTVGLLNEQNGLMGTTYTNLSPLSFGENHKSFSMGVSSAFALGGKRDLLVDAAIVRTDGAQLSDGLISSVSPLYARTLGAALVQRDAVRDGDNISISMRAPLRVFSGSATLASASVDSDGNPIITGQRISLRPTGNEVDFAVGYQQPVSENMSWSLTMDAHHDDGNVAGATSAEFLVGGKLRF